MFIESSFYTFVRITRNIYKYGNIYYIKLCEIKTLSVLFCPAAAEQQLKANPSSPSY